MEQLQQIFDCAVEAVMQASGLDFDALANCRSERCVVARVVLVDVLMELGMSEGDISLLSGMSQQRVNSLKNSARYRLKGLAARVMRGEVRKSVSLPIAENNRRKYCYIAWIFVFLQKIIGYERFIQRVYEGGVCATC